MEDVTGMVESAGICLQDLWNTHFRGPTDDMSSCPPELQDLFEGIEARLFAALVMRHLDRLHWPERFRSEPLPFLVVAPSARSEARVGRNALIERRSTHVFFDPSAG